MGNVDVKNNIRDDNDYGASINRIWVPAPRFAMRRRRILDLLNGYPVGKLIEIGPGAGALLRDLTQKGFMCTGYDTSPSALKVAKLMVGEFPNAEISHSPSSHWASSFDYLLSCEVLEHIEEDEKALNDWLTYLKSGGFAIIAVPSHQAKFGPLDKWAGHYRRYDKLEFVTLLKNSGLEIIHFESYGYPLANITSFFRNIIIDRSGHMTMAKDNKTDTARSGVERDVESKLYRFQTNFLGRAIMRVAFKIQYLFRNTELGDGFIVIAKKNEERQ